MTDEAEDNISTVVDGSWIFFPFLESINLWIMNMCVWYKCVYRWLDLIVWSRSLRTIKNVVVVDDYIQRRNGMSEEQLMVIISIEMTVGNANESIKYTKTKFDVRAAGSQWLVTSDVSIS